MERNIPYGITNYAELVRDHCYFVDKTPYIAQLERIKNPIFLRPKRFGKREPGHHYRYNEYLCHDMSSVEPGHHYRYNEYLCHDMSSVAPPYVAGTRASLPPHRARLPFH